MNSIGVIDLKGTWYIKKEKERGPKPIHLKYHPS